MVKECTKILGELYKEATKNVNARSVSDPIIFTKIENITKCFSNRSIVRFLMACLLAKIHRPEVDIRKPYTEISTEDSFSGRTYDEKYLTDFINMHDLPCNPTTAFLTPALRNINKALTIDTELVGRPRDVYKDVLFLLDKINRGKVSVKSVFLDCIRILITVKNKNIRGLKTLKSDSIDHVSKVNLSVGKIVSLLSKHFACKKSSRLPVLAVVAAYKSAQQYLNQKVLPLKPHTAADKQTKALGDVEITLIGDDNVVTCYEMKTKQITESDVNVALQKIKHSLYLNNYIFVTTVPVKSSVMDMVKKEDLSTGVEIVILDCIDFIKYFLHLFYDIRIKFLDEYQKLVLNEPISTVSQELKEQFIVMRKNVK